MKDAKISGWQFIEEEDIYIVYLPHKILINYKGEKTLTVQGKNYLHQVIKVNLTNPGSDRYQMHPSTMHWWGHNLTFVAFLSKYMHPKSNDKETAKNKLNNKKRDQIGYYQRQW